jgi:uncharacterized iron-regulated membrane protein
MGKMKSFLRGLALFLVLVAGLVVWHLRRRRRDRGAGEPPQPVTERVPDRVTEEPA